jgi:hypothetical protein
MLYRQTVIIHSLLNITIYIFWYPFPIALGMRSTWKFWNILSNKIQLHSLNEYLYEYNICIKENIYWYHDSNSHIFDLCINAILLPQFVYQWIWMSEQRTAFTFILPWNLVTCVRKSLTLIYAFLQIRQTYWCLCLTDTGINNCNYWKAEKSHLCTNTSKLQMTGIMTPAVCLHHFHFQT